MDRRGGGGGGGGKNQFLGGSLIIKGGGEIPPESLRKSVRIVYRACLVCVVNLVHDILSLEVLPWINPELLTK